MALNMAYEEKPIDFSTLVGTYRWVWDTQADARQVEREIMPSILGKKDDEEGGFITLSIEGDAKLNDLGKVCGVFRYGSIKGSFKGIKPFRNDSNKEFPGVFSIPHVSWEDEKQSLADDEQELWVTKEKDDHGDAFVGMYLTTGFMGWAYTASWNVVGKRQKEGYVLGEGRWEGLSWEEKERLRLKERDYGEDEEEEEDGDEEIGDDEDEEDDDDEGDSDDEDEDEDGDEEDKGEGEQKEVDEKLSERTTAKGEDKDKLVTSTVSASRKRKASVSEVKNTRQKQK